ncbi:DNA polymerase-3 subunit delta' [Rhodobacter aestuarii]|uniref:DNA polymerase-3 subunit delta n=1 Tax=Rhodobacter aestuarii TaxID=453582 RepID=A0A1N7P9I5_9RHOB|nr:MULTISPECIES: DNA polymerase III subunit delta' [Rhodobacter]PTV97685.1 DNA polymerase-3 subunit delta' [Rhodobacter aestuarii]SIT07263.1 DNA polymerase-3 subunit delta' [Rhodobacter aestuarii]SOC04690.1 DNA polymerase-3 subunit delta' [Rhodobacter sp. JA431]
MSEAEFPDPTQVEGAPHPRQTAHLYGQEHAEQAFLDAFNSGRLHHAWMLTGPRGVGKATFAWRIARFLLTQPLEQGGGLFGAPEPPRTLETDPEHPVCRRLLAEAEPRVFHLKRGLNDKKTAISDDIRVEEVRKLTSFLHLSAADGGRRVVVVDCADELATAGANALLKLLEEPPPLVTFLLVTHQPARLLPTIRSRCRELRLTTLAPDDLALALAAAEADAEGETLALSALAGGSVGEAIRLLNLEGLESYATLVGLFATLPRLDRIKAWALAESAAGKANAARFDLMLRLMDLFLSRLARAGLTGPPEPEAAKGEAQLMARLSPDGAAAMKWAGLHQELGARARHGKAVNLDPAALVMDMVLAINTAA